MSNILSRFLSLSKHLVGLLLIWMLLRIGFYYSNPSFFKIKEDGLSYFLLYGMRFDIAAIFMINALWITLYLIPIKWNKIYASILVMLFTIINSFAILFELADWQYFPFNKRRSTFEIFHIVGNKGDFLSIFTSFLVDYWYLFIIAIVLIIALYKFSKYLTFKHFKKAINTPVNMQWMVQQSAVLLLVAGLIIIGVRGGLQLKPIGMKDAILVTSNENVPLILNTTYNIIASGVEPKMERIEWMTAAEARAIHPTQYEVDTTGEFAQKNVVFVVLESFTKGFTGLSNYQKCTPFLDSLMARSLTFTNGYANALQSIQGLPAIVAGVPGMMDQAFANSVYANNKLSSIANLLKEKGYSTGFFHGATNGSMSIDIFAKNAGYDFYFGRTEYNNEKDYDGNWGIWDEPFLQRVAKEMNQMKAPFHSLVFNLNSHPPYTIPADKADLFQHIEGSPVNRAVAYADYSFKKFFETISKESWYHNTVFVFVADHTSAIFDADYFSFGLGRYEIPIFIFDPNEQLITPAYNHQLISQIDIVPTLMRLLHYDQPFYAFGRDVLQEPASVLTKMGSAHIFIRGGYRVVIEDNVAKELYLHPADSLGQYNLVDKLENTVILDSLLLQYRAMLQVYNNDLIDNAMW